MYPNEKINIEPKYMISPLITSISRSAYSKFPFSVSFWDEYLWDTDVRKGAQRNNTNKEGVTRIETDTRGYNNYTEGILVNSAPLFLDANILIYVKL